MDSSPTNKRVLVTGASGFIGRHCCNYLRKTGYRVRAVVRGADSLERVKDVSDDAVVIRDIGRATSWSGALEQVETIVHLAARAHIWKDGVADPGEVFRSINASGTVRLAEVGADCGVKRLVYVSTIGVHGDVTDGKKAFTELDPLEPQTAYAQSKMEAEQQLRRIERERGLDVVVIRPPLVHGPGVPGNLFRLLRLVALGIPLPLGGIRSNRRSLVGVRNLSQFIATCVRDTRASGETFIVADSRSISTRELIVRLSDGMRRRPRLFPVPGGVSKCALKALGKERLACQLFGSLEVDCGNAKRRLGWEPEQSLEDGLREMADWYIKTQGIRARDAKKGCR